MRAVLLCAILFCSPLTIALSFSQIETAPGIRSIDFLITLESKWHLV